MGKSEPNSRPVSLQIVTFIMIAIGVVASFSTIGSTGRGGMQFSLNSLALIFGLGLMFLRNWARTCTILYAGGVSIIAFTGILDAIFDLRIMTVTRQGVPIDARAAAGPVIAVCLVAGGIMIWTIRVLLRKDVSLLFGDRFHLQPNEHARRSRESQATDDDGFDVNGAKL